MGKKKILVISERKNYKKALEFINTFGSNFAISHASCVDQAKDWLMKKGKRYFNLLIIDPSIKEEELEAKSKIVHWDPNSQIHPVLN